MYEVKNLRLIGIPRMHEEYSDLHLLSTGDMKLFRHHIYEYEKGLRDMILHTTGRRFEQEVKRILNRKNIDYVIQPVSDNKINVFFGDAQCIHIIQSIGKKNLSEYTDEEDFILGIMLGYDRMKQCGRYIKRKNARINSKS